MHDVERTPASTRRSILKQLAGAGSIAALPLIGGARTASAASPSGAGAILVAASDAPDSVRSAADFLCDGKADDVEIQAALDSLPTLGGRVVLSPGTFKLAASVNIDIEGTSLLAQGSLLSWGNAPDASTPLLSVNQSDCFVDSVRCRGSRSKVRGTGIRLYGDGKNEAVNAVTLLNCRCENLAVGIEIGIVGSGSVGDCTIVGARINNCGVGILSRGFTNRIYSPFISNVDVGIQQTTDRASGSFQLFGGTINNWSAQALLFERGRDFVVDSLWAEHTGAVDQSDGTTDSTGALEVVRIGSPQYEVVNPRFTGVQSFHLPDAGAGASMQFVFRLVQCRGLQVDAIRLGEQVPTALVNQVKGQSGVDNRIGKVVFGPGPVPDGWDATHLVISDRDATGEVIIEQPPDVAGSPAGATVGGVVPNAGDLTIAQVASGTYFAVQRNGHVAAFGRSLKQVVESVLASDRHIHFARGTFDFGPDHAVFNGLEHLVLSGEGEDLTIVVNDTDEKADTEPFSFTRCNTVVVRDFTISAGGKARSTSDALDFDDGSDCLIERVRVVKSRGRGIVFDGKDPGAKARRNVIRGCSVTGCAGTGLELLVAEHCQIIDCRSFGNGEHGAKINRDPATGAKSLHNRITGGEFTDNTSDGISILEADYTSIEGVRCMNNGRDGIRVEVFEDGDLVASQTGIVACFCSDDRDDGEKSQQFGIQLLAPKNGEGRITDTLVMGNRLLGNAAGGFSDGGTGTVASGNVGVPA